MDVTRLIAERRIEEAIGDGRFDDVAGRGYIDCSLSGERFFAHWFATKLEREGYSSPTRPEDGPLHAKVPSRELEVD